MFIDQYTSHLKDWLGDFTRQHCLTKPYDTSLSPMRLLMFFSTLENVRKRKHGISPGHRVTLLDTQTKELSTFFVVEPSKSDPENARISYLSPLGNKLIGRNLGDLIEIKLFFRTEKFRVIRIEDTQKKALKDKSNDNKISLAANLS